MVKNPPANAGDIGDAGLIPKLGGPLGAENDNPLQYSCLGNLMVRGAQQATIHGVTESDTTEHAHTHTSCYCYYATYTGLSFPQTLSVVTAYMSHLKSTNII